jgi:hypothetical protein
LWNCDYLYETEMILVGGGFIVVVVTGEVNLWSSGAHGGPRKISGQDGGEEDQDEPKRTHFFQFQSNKLITSQALAGNSRIVFYFLW